MSLVELDPLFVRALRLLHSKSKDSELQLRSMLDDCLRARKSGGGVNIMPSIPSSNVQQQRSAREVERRNLDKLKRDLIQLVPNNGGKKSRIDSPRHSISHTPSPTPMISNNDDIDMDEINLEGLNDCTCCVCKSFNQENGNKLMECHTCQNLFHQGCHSPVISDHEVADPRLVWNCSDCSKSIKQPAKMSSSSSSGKSMNVKSARASPSKLEGSALFKRTEVKAQSSGSVGGGKPAGMAALAASFTSSKSSSLGRSSRSAPSSSSSSSSSSASSNNSTMMNADKRLQMMKKKAAAAAQRKVK